MADDTQRVIIAAMAKVKHISIVRAKMLLVDLRAAVRYIWGLMTGLFEGSTINAKTWYEDAKSSLIKKK